MRVARVIVVCEGRTEEAFARNVLQPQVAAHGVFLEPRLISTSPRARGGALDGQRVRRYLRNTLRESTDTYVTTFFDLYGLPSSFPGQDSAKRGDSIAQARHIEYELRAQVIAQAGCHQDRFVPHIQPYEFEALLFSDITAFEATESAWGEWAHELQEARAHARGPEHINDGANTHPSALLRRLKPKYRKVAHGVAVSSCAGLTRIRVECRHFGCWLSWLESLAGADGVDFNP